MFYGDIVNDTFNVELEKERQRRIEDLIEINRNERAENDRNCSQRERISQLLHDANLHVKNLVQSALRLQEFLSGEALYETDYRTDMRIKTSPAQGGEKIENVFGHIIGSTPFGLESVEVAFRRFTIAELKSKDTLTRKELSIEIDYEPKSSDKLDFASTKLKLVSVGSENSIGFEPRDPIDLTFDKELLVPLETLAGDDIEATCALFAELSLR